MTNRQPARMVKLLARFGKPQLSSRFQYVTVHPLVDEPEVLARAGTTAAECVLVDCYWVLEEHVAFVSVSSSHDQAPFASFHWRKGTQAPPRFYVVTRRFPLTTVVLETILRRLEEWFGEHRRARPREALVIAESDLGQEE